MGHFSDICPECGAKVSKRERFCGNCGHGAPNGWTKCPGCGKWISNEAYHCPHCNHPLHPEERVDLAGGVWDRDPKCFAQRFELGDTARVMKNGLMIQEGTVAVLLDGGKESKVLGPGRHEPQGTLRAINWFGNPPPRTAVMVDSGDVVFRVDFTESAAAPVPGGEVGVKVEAAAAEMQTEEDGVSAVAASVSPVYARHVPLRSAEELPVGATAEVTLRFKPSQADDFVANFMKDLRSVSTKDVCAWIYEEAVSAVKDMCLQSKIEDLVKDPDRRERFEDAIRRALKEPLARSGLELVRVGAVEFYGPAYEDMRAKYGELEKERRKVEFMKKQLEVIADSDNALLEDERRGGDIEMARAKRAKDVKDYLDQLAQEKELGEIDRTSELQIAVRVAKGEVGRKEAELAAARELEEHAKAMTALAHRLELDLTLRNYDREQLIKDAENRADLAAIQRRENELDVKSQVVISGDRIAIAKNEAEAKKATVDGEIYEADKWLNIKAKKNAINNKDLRERMEIVGGRSAQDVAAAAAMGGDSATASAFLSKASADAQMAHTENMAKIQAGMSVDQIFASGAAQDPNAAKEAYARAKEAEEKASKQVLEELKAAERDRHQHDDKVLDKIADIAKTSVEHQSTTVVPPTPVTNMQH